MNTEQKMSYVQEITLRDGYVTVYSDKYKNIQQVVDAVRIYKDLSSFRYHFSELLAAINKAIDSKEVTK